MAVIFDREDIEFMCLMLVVFIPIIVILAFTFIKENQIYMLWLIPYFIFEVIFFRVWGTKWHA